jgi:hypothetical protein
MLFRLVKDMSYTYEEGSPTVHDAEGLELRCKALVNKLITLRDAFVLKNQTTMLKVLGVEDDRLKSAPARSRKSRQRRAVA